MNTAQTTVIGAGYAGVMAANRLAAHGADVTLIAARDVFVERIRLHRVAAGLRPHAHVPMATLVHPAVVVRRGTATRVRWGEHAIDLADGTVIDYDQAVIAVGAGRSEPALLSVTDDEAAGRTRAALAARPDAPVSVVGAGLTGIETACALAHAGRVVTLHVRGTRGGPDETAHVRQLRRLGIRLADNEPPRPDALVIDTTGFRTQPLAVASGLPVDDHGLIRVAPDLSIPEVPDVYAAGDAVSLTLAGWEHLRPSCATAMPLGAHAADTLLAHRDGRASHAFDLGYIARCVDLGGGIGRVQFVTRDDRAVGAALTGHLGGLAKETINRATLRWVRGERDRAGSYHWAHGPRQAHGVVIPVA